jgi:hypothetical protein
MRKRKCLWCVSQCSTLLILESCAVNHGDMNTRTPSSSSPFLDTSSHVQLNNELVRLRKEKMEQDSLVATLRDEVGALTYLPIFLLKSDS